MPLLSLDEARKALWRCSSYTRLDAALRVSASMDRGDWFQVLGEFWSICDNIGAKRASLRRLLAGSPREFLDRMMTPQELKTLAAMPERIPVWRGCYEHNVNGLSWTTDRQVAAGFPFLTRYRANSDPLLVSGWTRRDKAVLKLDRGEAEIIAARVVRTAIEPLAQPAPA